MKEKLKEALMVKYNELALSSQSRDS